MKIERINENQIRCTLTGSDLESRQIRLSELAYGSDKAKLLFRDMMQQARSSFGFETDNSPLMIEAIPLSHDSIVLIITKVEDPEELDTRFSRFSSPAPEVSAFAERHLSGADEILDLFQKLTGIDASESHSSSGKQTQKPAEPAETSAEVTASVDLIQAYRLPSLETAVRAAHCLKELCTCTNTLLKDAAAGEYCLLLHADHMEPETFNKLCNILTEYGNSFSLTPAAEAHMLEHGDVLIADHALQSLADFPQASTPQTVSKFA